MTRINLTVPARNLKIGDDLRTHYGSPSFNHEHLEQQGIVSGVTTAHGITYVWLEGRTAGACNVILNHADRCYITRERVEPKPSRWMVVGPDDCNLVDIHENALEDTHTRGIALAISQDEARDLARLLTEAFREDV